MDPGQYYDTVERIRRRIAADTRYDWNAVARSKEWKQWAYSLAAALTEFFPYYPAATMQAVLEHLESLQSKVDTSSTPKPNAAETVPPVPTPTPSVAETAAPASASESTANETESSEPTQIPCQCLPDPAIAECFKIPLDRQIRMHMTLSRDYSNPKIWYINIFDLTKKDSEWKRRIPLWGRRSPKGSCTLTRYDGDRVASQFDGRVAALIFAHRMKRDVDPTSKYELRIGYVLFTLKGKDITIVHKVSSGITVAVPYTSGRELRRVLKKWYRK